MKLFDELSRKGDTLDADEFAPSSKGFGHWLKVGLAASLPLIITILVAVVIMVVKGR